MKIKNSRKLVQMSVLITVIISALAQSIHSLGKAIPWLQESYFHYICPTCGVVSIYQFFASQTIWADKVKSILGLIIATVIIITIIFGPIICGFICPFGTIQDLTANIGKKMFRNKYNKFIPKKLDEKLKYLRYITLISTVILTITANVMIIEAINPYHAFLGIFNAKSISLIGFGVLVFIIIASLFVQRPWCRYLCPYGALLGIFNKFKVFRVIRKDKTCVGCKKCDNRCPIGIEVHNKDFIRDLSCISCLECVDKSVCPNSKTIVYTSDEIELEEETNKEEKEMEIN